MIKHRLSEHRMIQYDTINKQCCTNSETNILELHIKKNKLIYFLIHS